MASWEKYLEGNYDSDNTKMEEQKTEDEYEAREVAEKITELFEQYKKRSDIKKYLVEGAVLRCSKATTNPFYLPDGSEIKLENIDNETEDEKIERQRIWLYIKEKDAKMMVGDSLYATVVDAEKGELAELIEKRKENEDLLEANIYPFQCNCLEPIDREEEEKIIKENKEQCVKYGVCQYLMRLNAVWENVPLPAGSFYETREQDGQRKDAECITMTSMLFCKHGGLITPVDSGQEINKLFVDLNIIKRYLSEGTVDEGMVENALIDLARISGKQLIQYGSNLGLDYNKYDDYIIGWSEYYKYVYSKEFDPAMIKSQLYQESRIGHREQYLEGTRISIPAANPHRDIMQVLDVRNDNIYEYIDIATDNVLALTSGKTYMTTTEMRKINGQSPLSYVSNQDKKNRCGGIVASLFNTKRHGTGDRYVQGSTNKSYYMVYSKVTPVMSIGVGIDTMMELLKDKNYYEALKAYNGKEGLKEQYAREISERAQLEEFQGD